MKKITTILMTLVLCLSLSLITSAANGKYMGSFRLDKDEAININSIDYVPLREVALALDYDFDWEREKAMIYGHLDHRNFEAKYFWIANGHLYLPISYYPDLFDLEINIKGNKYYIYSTKSYTPVVTDLKLVLQTNKLDYRKNEPIAVSLLLSNQSNSNQTLRFSSGKKYDLILTRYNREIWRLSDNMNYHQAISYEVIKEGDYRLFTSLIEPGKYRYLPSGNYTLIAEITTTNGIIISEEVEIEIY